MEPPDSPDAQPRSSSPSPHPSSAPTSPPSSSYAADSPLSTSLPASSPQKIDSPRQSNSVSASPSSDQPPAWSRALSAFGMLSVYGRGSTAVLPPTPVTLDNEQLYPHRLCGFLRNQDNTKLAPEEEIILKRVVPAGRYLVQVENHDLLSGPALSVVVQVVSSQKDGAMADELIFESECAKLSSKTSLMDRSDHEVRFEVPENQHAIVHLQVRNTGQWGWRGCKGSLVLRGNVDQSDLVRADLSLEELLHAFNQEYGPQLLPGERKSKVVGSLFITNYQLIFVPNKSACIWLLTQVMEDSRLASAAASEDSRAWRIPHGLVLKVDWIEGEQWTAKIHLRTPCCIKLRTLAAHPFETSLKISNKDCWSLTGVRGKDTPRQIKELLLRLAFPSNPLHVFAFTLGQMLVERDPNHTGWNRFDPMKEYARMGLVDAKEWRVSEVNISYELCDTYPRFLVVPSIVSDEQLKAVAAYRSRGRVPVVVWRHSVTGAVLLRCSQPLSGISGAKCADDIAFFETVRQLNTTHPATLYIYDARPQINAVGNSLMGKGYEAPSLYKNCRLVFLNIDNIQVMSASYKRLRDCVISSDSTQRDLVELDWMTHIERLLSSTHEMAAVLAETGASIVTHCSDGWDRTSQLCSLVQLFLDSHARTFDGFAILVEKEWLSFGHQFTKRIGLGPESEESYLSSFVGERGPIFLQFIDCIFQLTLQYPTAFEFNEQFLRHLLVHLYAGRFGTFLLNSDRERRQYAVAAKTASVWSIIDNEDELAPMHNPTFDPAYGRLAALPQKPRFWTAYYAPPAAHSFE